MSLVVRRYAGLGRGVYSTRRLRRGDVVEVSPVIVLTRADWKAVRGTHLERYVFAWGKSGRANALPLGLGGVFNHANDPNLDFSLNHRNESITFRALRDIPAGEQLTINYGWSARDRRRWLGSPSKR
jgi:SET domain-containing protein